MPSKIAKIARKYLNDPVHVEIERERTAEGAAPRVRQEAYIVTRSHKPAALGRILDVEAPPLHWCSVAHGLRSSHSPKR